jgi:hypothetical protein
MLLIKGDTHMKNIFTLGLALTALAASSTASIAGGNKTSLLHCGCTDTGDAMMYHDISVSGNSKGHQNHTATSTDSCLTSYDAEGYGIYADFVRTGDDCTLEGELEGLIACADFDSPPIAGNICGEELIQ